MPNRGEVVLSSDDYESDEELGHINERNRQFGAKILAKANFGSRKKEIVESSFQKSLDKGDKLPGKNNERRNLAFLRRLDEMMIKHGPDAGKRLLRAAASEEGLIIRDEDVPEEANGLRGESREGAIDAVQQRQKESIEAWVNILGSEQAPFPAWFKVFAWDGMSKMGAYNKEKQRYERRDQHTIAPFPACNVEILSKMYNYLTSFYGEDDFGVYDDDNDELLAKALESGNFAGMYAAIERNMAPVVETPMNPEDVRGQWVAYVYGQEQLMTKASTGTGWCTANPATTSSYMRFGNYEEPDDGVEGRNSFLVFHLEDPENEGKLAKNGCIAIMLDENGVLTNEVRGLGDQEDIEDSLIGILKAKIETLPGNGKLMQKIVEREKILELFDKISRDEELTREDIAFVDRATIAGFVDGTGSFGYGPNRKLESIETNIALKRMVANGASLKEIAEERGLDTLDNLGMLAKLGLNMDGVEELFSPSEIIERLDTLKESGVDIDVQSLANQLKPYEVVSYIEVLERNGVVVDVNELIKNVDSFYIANSVDALLRCGADAKALLEEGGMMIHSLQPFYDAEVPVEDIIESANAYVIARNIKDLIERGANVDRIVEKIGPSNTVYNLELLMKAGAHIDVNELASELRADDLYGNWETLKRYGMAVSS